MGLSDRSLPFVNNFSGKLARELLCHLTETQ